MRFKFLLGLIIILHTKGISQEEIEVAGVTINVLENQYFSENELPNEKWLSVGDGQYIMSFRQTPVGYKHSLDQVKIFLEANNLSFDDNRYYESILLPKLCNGVFDYHCLPYWFRADEAEVVINWLTYNRDTSIGIKCGSKGFFVTVDTKHSKKEEGVNLGVDPLHYLNASSKNNGNDTSANLMTSKGNSYSSAYYGSPLNGLEYGLNGRALVSKGKVQQDCNEEGRVVVRILVDRNGEVVRATPGVKGSTNTAQCLLKAARKTALLYRWNLDENAPGQQMGYLVVNFKLGN